MSQRFFELEEEGLIAPHLLEPAAGAGADDDDDDEDEGLEIRVCFVDGQSGKVTRRHVVPLPPVRNVFPHILRQPFLQNRARWFFWGTIHYCRTVATFPQCAA